jgi:tetratricopeptide (TPR) repeat protein
VKKSLAAALVVSSITSVAWAQRDPAQEAKIDQAVSAVDPALVDALHEANAAADRGDEPSAAKAYARVHAGAPAVSDVTRRLCTAEARSGNWAAGVQHCREALAADGSAENHAALAMAVLTTQPLQQGQIDEAATEAKAAVRLAPNKAFAQSTFCEVAAADNDFANLDTCSAKLEVLAPNAPTTHLFRAIVLGHDGDIDGAEQELDRAHAAGLAQASYDHTRAMLEAMRPPPHTFRTILMTTLTSWIALIFFFIVGGMLLGDGLERGSSRARRALERRLLALAVGLFYASAAIATIAIGLGVALVVIAFFAVIRLPRAVEVALAAFGLYVLVGIGRSVFAKIPTSDWGDAIDLGDHEALGNFIDRVETAIKAPPIDRVVVRPDAEIEVLELGGSLGHLRRRNERVLAVGVGALDGLTQRQLAAVVAAELGRRRRGEAGGDLALVEIASLDAALDRMETRGVATDANPAWWFVRIWRAMFTRVADGAVLLQEESADARAAEAFGKDALEAGLRHVAKRRVEMAALARASIRDAIDGADVVDLYARSVDEDVREEIDEEMKLVSERLEPLTVEGDEPTEDCSDEPAWALFADRAALEREMAERVKREIHERAGFRLDQPSSASSVASA